MSETPKVVFMNTGQSILDWFWRGPSVQRVEQFPWPIKRNETGGALQPEEWAEFIAEADVLLTSWGTPRLDETILARNDRLRIVGHVGGSVAPIASEELYRRGVKVCTANPLMARSVAEAGLMMMLMGLRRAHMHCQLGDRCSMIWGQERNIRPPSDCAIGIWGYGDTAQWLVKLLRPFEPARLLVNSGHLSEEAAAAEGMEKVEFDDLFAQSDVIFCLTGMTVANHHRVSTPQLQAIKDGALLINLGRAPLLDPVALIEELSRGRFMGLFDVFEQEPLPETDPLAHLPNVINFPHEAGGGRDAWYLATMLDEVERFYRGEPLQYEVPASRAEVMTDLGRVREYEAEKK